MTEYAWLKNDAPNLDQVVFSGGVFFVLSDQINKCKLLFGVRIFQMIMTIFYLSSQFGK